MNSILKQYIKINGGATVEHGTIIEPKSGYAVAISNHIMDLDEMADFTDIRGLKGYWLDTETNEMYIDDVVIIQNFFTAVSVAKSHNQKAIYDFTHKKEFKVADSKKYSAENSITIIIEGTDA